MTPATHAVVKSLPDIAITIEPSTATVGNTKVNTGTTWDEISVCLLEQIEMTPKTTAIAVLVVRKRKSVNLMRFVSMVIVFQVNENGPLSFDFR